MDAGEGYVGPVDDYSPSITPDEKPRAARFREQGSLYSTIMRQIFFFLTVLFVLFHSVALAQANIAVMELRNYGVSNNEVSALTDRLRTELFLTGKFKVIEREMMEEILNEQGFQQTGCTTDECLVNIGQLIGVEQMIGGSISKVGSVYSVSVRIISVETGEIVKTGTYDYEGNIGNLLRFGMKNVAMILTGTRSKETSQTVATSNQIVPGLKLSDRPVVPEKKNATIKPRVVPKSTPLSRGLGVYSSRKKSLIGNTFKSLVFPGWGQYALQKKRGNYYLPAILFLFYLWNDSEEATYTAKFIFRDGSYEESPTFSSNSEANDWQDQFQFHGREVVGSVMSQDIVYYDQYLNAMMAIYIVNLVDVAVTTYFYNMEIEKMFNLSIIPIPVKDHNSIMFSLNYYF